MLKWYIVSTRYKIMPYMANNKVVNMNIDDILKRRLTTDKKKASKCSWKTVNNKYTTYCTTNCNGPCSTCKQNTK